MNVTYHMLPVQSGGMDTRNMGFGGTRSIIEKWILRQVEQGFC